MIPTSLNSDQENLPPYQWQSRQWEQLIAYQTHRQIPQALILQGAKGLGKFELALAWAKLLLCENASHSNLACNNCRSCALFQANSHPDLYLIVPESSGKSIKVDQIRELNATLNQTSQLGSYKIIIFNPANSMNMAAQNALLKTLEEPNYKTLLILVTAQPLQLAATIRSRCQRINFPNLTDHEALQYLPGQFNSAEKKDLALLSMQGAPLAFQTGSENNLAMGAEILQSLVSLLNCSSHLLQLAEKWSKQDLSFILVWLYIWVSEIILLISGAKNNSINSSLGEQLIVLGQRGNLIKLFSYLDILHKIKYSLNRQSNINSQLLLESLLSQWISLYKGF